jgi:excisionase family DNA binding protein
MLTVPEAARRAGRNPETIRRWIREGKLVASKVGSQHVIDEDDLAEMTRGRADRGIAEVAPGYGTAVAPAREPERVADEWLSAIVGRIVRAVDPVRIVLLGARANGAAPPESDYELLVVLDDVQDRMASRVAVRRSFEDIPAPAEVTVASVEEMDSHRIDIATWADAAGRSVYARDVAR